jgi:hypothetical protein
VTTGSMVTGVFSVIYPSNYEHPYASNCYHQHSVNPAFMSGRRLPHLGDVYPHPNAAHTLGRRFPHPDVIRPPRFWVHSPRRCTHTRASFTPPRRCALTRTRAHSLRHQSLSAICCHCHNLPNIRGRAMGGRVGR